MAAPAEASGPTTAGRRASEPLSRGQAAAWGAWRPRFFTFAEILDGWERALARRGAPGSPPVVHVYAHFPHCETSCRFCMYFHRLPRDEGRVHAVALRLARTIDRHRERLGPLEVTNAYFGGGTPSLLQLADLRAVFRAFGAAFRVGNTFTFEGNPLSLDADKIALAADAGVTRISMGVQAFDRDVLRTIARVNGPAARTAGLVAAGRRAGLEVNVDILLGLPGHDPARFRDEVRQAVDLGADTVTIYRYQPVARLDVPPSFFAREVFRAQELVAIAAAGYAPLVPRHDDSVGAKLVRWPLLGRWTARIAAGRLRDRAGARGYGREYGCFEARDAHVIGFGTGAWSHTYGSSWHREVTPVDSPDAEPVFHGSPLSAEDECRTDLLAALHAGDWIDPARQRAISGVDPAVRFRDAFDAALRAGTVERRFGRLRRRRGADAGALVDALMPEPADPIGPPAGLRFQKELVSESERAGDVTAAWRDLLGVPAPGAPWLGAEVVSIGSGELRIRVGGGVLRVHVTRAGSGPSYAGSARFAIAPGPSDRPLDTEETAFLARLTAEMQRRDPAA